MIAFKERLDCNKPDIALGLDMINELHRCPKALYETLSADNQKLFRKSFDDQSFQDVLMIRHTDRFPYFAMRYIDDRKVFGNIRFLCNLGKYRYKFYMKRCIDNGQSRVRSLQKELNGFGRYQELESLRTGKWKCLIRPFENYCADTADTKPYITDVHTHYVINGNRIGLSVSLTSDGTGDYFPTIDEDTVNSKASDAWLSTFELPAIIFLHLLGGNPEDIILEHIRNKRQLYKDIISHSLVCGTPESIIRQKYSLSFAQLPEKIVDYLCEKTFDAEEKFARHKTTVFEEMRKETELLKSYAQIDSKSTKKRGQKGYQAIKVGQLAQILAKDIISLQKADRKNHGSNKLTGLNFSVMQSALALYDLDTLKRIFVSAGLTAGEFQHPFLKKVVDKSPNSIIALYLDYMEQRHWFAEQCIKRQKNIDILKKESAKWIKRDDDFYLKLTKRYLAQPIELPRGLFLDAIKAQLATLDNAYIDQALYGTSRDELSDCAIF